MTKRRWPVVVEVRKSRTRRREGRQSTAKAVPVSEAAQPATHTAGDTKNEPEAALPQPGPLAREIVNACRGRMSFPEKLW